MHFNREIYLLYCVILILKTTHALHYLRHAVKKSMQKFPASVKLTESFPIRQLRFYVLPCKTAPIPRKLSMRFSKTICAFRQNDGNC